MSKWTSDAKQRASKKYRWIHDELAGNGIAPNLKAITAVPAFTVSYGGDDLDKRQRHILHSREWKRHGE